tara:strand:+ start:1733 stop:2938 length:1206 start_codon:yes stop_codon:yes gene_type:complete
MKLLLVHQNFPGQFRDLGPALCDRGHELKAIGSSQRPTDQRIEVLRYQHNLGERSGVHPHSLEVDEWITRSEQVANLAMKLKQRGWAPDVMLAHPGWGEALLLRQVFPSTPLVIWPELWLRPEHLGISSTGMNVGQMQYLRIKDWLIDGAMADASLAVLPTQYQASTFPARWQHKIAVVHEGVPEAMLQLPRLGQLTIANGVTLGQDVPVVTFISRNLEPMRGFPTFMRAMPSLLAHNPKVQIVIVGGDEVSYSSAPGDGRTWRDHLLEELGDRIDRNRVHLFGRMPHDQLQKLYRRSDLHVYLSKAFVLSWSLLELMACGTPVLGEANSMMEELIQPGVNGALWRGQPENLAKAILTLLEKPDQLRQWGRQAKQQLQPTYLQQHCLNQLEHLLQQQANCF